MLVHYGDNSNNNNYNDMLLLLYIIILLLLLLLSFIIVTIIIITKGSLQKGYLDLLCEAKGRAAPLIPERPGERDPPSPLLLRPPAHLALNTPVI